MTLSEPAIAALNVESKLKPRHTGIVTGIDRAGTTVFVTTDDGRKFLAFQGNPIMRTGDQVSFRIDQQRAIDVVKLEPIGETNEHGIRNSGIGPSS
jgi:hypothetical protein